MSDCGCSRESRFFEDGFEREGRFFEDRRGEFNSRRGCRCLANDVERLIRDIRKDARELECKFDKLEDRGCIRRNNNWDNWDNGCNRCGCNRSNRCSRCSRCGD